LIADRLSNQRGTMLGMTCPLCHQPTTWEENPWRPFCSERCQMTDLGAWAAERYRIPGPSLTMDTSLPDSCEGDDDTEARQNSEAKESKDR
jgi:endogenous inhibitor of DNA gyrase (YacG/DUF329 family)